MPNIVQNPVGLEEGGMGRAGRALAGAGARQAKQAMALKRENRLVMSILNDPKMSKMIDPEIKNWIENRAPGGPAKGLSAYLKWADEFGDISNFRDGFRLFMGEYGNSQDGVAAMKAVADSPNVSPSTVRTLNEVLGMLTARSTAGRDGSAAGKSRTEQRKIMDDLTAIPEAIRKIQKDGELSDMTKMLIAFKPELADKLQRGEKIDPKEAIQALRVRQQMLTDQYEGLYGRLPAEFTGSSGGDRNVGSVNDRISKHMKSSAGRKLLSSLNVISKNANR